MKKYLTLALVGVFILLGCTDNDVNLPIDTNGISTLDVQISSVGFTDDSTTGRIARTTSSSNNLTWNHIFGGTGTITFTNTSTVTPIDSTYAIDMADFALNGLSKTLINGNYDAVLTMTGNTPVDYAPVNAADSFTLSNNTSLVLDATTTYGMLLLDPYLVDATVIPIFSAGGIDYNLAEDQGYYYLYIPDGVTGTVTLKESLFGQTVTKEVTIESTTIDALELVPVTSSAGITLILEEFEVEYDQWDINAPVNGITPSFGVFTDSGQLLGNADSHDVQLGDLDGDGDLDALVINRVQSSKVWFNGGDGSFTDSGQALGGNGDVSAALGDLDGDGDLDAYVTNFNNQGNSIWLNDGNGNFTDGGQVLGNSASSNVALVDLDDDGDLDAFVANSDYLPNKVWLNDGNGVFTDSGQILGNNNSRNISLGDIDGDGDLDAITGNWDQPSRVWMNDGNGNFTDSGQAIGNPTGATKEVDLGDVDGDGDLDVFIVGYWNSQPNTVWLNNGNGIFTDSGQTLASDQAADMSLKDLDGDGDLDAFVVHFDRPDKVWFNDGNGVFIDSGQSLGNSYGQAVSIGDLDGDGDLDAFIAEQGQPNRIWINN